MVESLLPADVELSLRYRKKNACRTRRFSYL